MTAAHSEAQQVRDFWIDEVGPKGWYAQDADLDADISRRFAALWDRASQGALEGWGRSAEDALAYLILTDQFPRNMFRGDARAFATDARALCTAKCAIGKELDQKIPEPQRQFFFLPLMHSESLTDQDQAVRMFLTRMPQSGAENLLHARAHREVIRLFGRFPYRNAALGRATTAAEQRFLDNGGYGQLVIGMRSRAA